MKKLFLFSTFMFFVFQLNFQISFNDTVYIYPNGNDAIISKNATDDGFYAKKSGDDGFVADSCVDDGFISIDPGYFGFNSIRSTQAGFASLFQKIKVSFRLLLPHIDIMQKIQKILLSILNHH